MGKGKTILGIVFALLVAGVGCHAFDCDDSHNPMEPSSCSYNPEMVELSEDRNATVTEVFFSKAGETEVYVVLSPPTVRPGRLPHLTLVNRGDTNIGYGSTYTLARTDPKTYAGGLTDGCMFQASLMVIQPDGESEPQEIGPCAERPLKPGTYRVVKRLVFDPGGSERPGTAKSYFEVKR